jgi:hypothetical protein
MEWVLKLFPPEVQGQELKLASNFHLLLLLLLSLKDIEAVSPVPYMF